MGDLRGAWRALSLALIVAVTALPASALDETYQRPGSNGSAREVYNRFFGGGNFGKSYALVIGVGDYDTFDRLGAPAQDAKRVRDFLRDEAGFDYIVTLTDADATRDRIRRLMDNELPARLGGNDRLFFYFSGHGATRKLAGGAQRGYLVLKPSQRGGWDQMIDMPSVREWAENLGGVRHVLFLLDACFSGLAAYQGKSADVKSKTLDRLNQPASHLVTAGVDQEESYAYNGESLFTQAFLAAARGRLDPPADGILSLDEIIVRINHEIDAKRAELGDRVRMTPQLYKERTEDNAGEFFFLLPNGRPVSNAQSAVALNRPGIAGGPNS